VNEPAPDDRGKTRPRRPIKIALAAAVLPLLLTLWIADVARSSADTAGSLEPVWILLGGLLATGMLGALVWSLASTQALAQARALRMTRTLSASEARFRAVVENVVDGIVVLDEHGTIQTVNPAAQRLFGYDDAELTGRNVSHLFGPPEGADLLGRRKDGSTVLVEFSISEMHVGEDLLFTGILRDVSARRKGERRRAAQFEATRVLSEGLAVDVTLPRILEAVCNALAWDFGGFWELDRRAAALRNVAAWSAAGTSGTLLDATRGLALARGIGLPGRVWDEGSPVWVDEIGGDPNAPRAAALAQEELRTAAGAPVVLGGELVGVIEFFNRRREPRDEELLQTFVTIGSLLGQFLDRKRAEEALRASEARTRSVLDNMLEALVVVNEDSVIEAVNPAAEKTFGYPAAQLVGQHLKTLLPRGRMPDAEGYLRDARKRALGKVTTWEGRRKNGDLFPFELSLYEFTTAHGRSFAGHVRDLSERHEVERMKKEFVATVSHELRTPLASIRGSLSLLSAGVLGPLGTDAAEAVGIAERNTLHLIALINDILDLERLENGRLEMNLRPSSLGPALERAHDAVRGMAEAQGVALALEITDAQVLGDEDRLVQVLVNLLSNAVKFSPRGGAVTVCSQEVDGFVEVAVRDHGRGIPRSYQRSVFERFQQVEVSDSRQKGGTGLGLAICKAIIEQHGGTIGVESELGRGSTFWFRVPASADQRALPVPQGLPRGAGAGA
jgi:PAS domain S-box-containing protein